MKRPRLNLTEQQIAEIARLTKQHGRRKVVLILAARRTHGKGVGRPERRLAELRDGKLFPQPVAISPTAVWNISRKAGN